MLLLFLQYSTQPEGYLELELGDWKDNRIFRLMAVDQGQLIFKDAIYDKSKLKTDNVVGKTR